MTIEIIATINSDGARRGADQLNRSLQSASGNVARFDRGIVSLNRALGAAGAFMAARAILNVGKAAISAADDFTRLEARLNAIGTGGFTAGQVMEAVADAANRARVPVNDLTDVYARNAAALERLGYNQSEAIRIAETLSKLGTLSGGSAASVSAALFQLSQAFNSGTLRGEEFNSIAEQTPEVLRALADATGRPVGELRKLASEGKITAETVADAMLYVSESTDERFGKMGMTVDQSLTLLSNSFAENWGRISKEVGVTENWSRLIRDFNSALEEPLAKDSFRLFAQTLSLVSDAARGVGNALGYAYEQARAAGAEFDKRLAASGQYVALENEIARIASESGTGGGRRRGGRRNGNPSTGVTVGQVPLYGRSTNPMRERPKFGLGTGDDSEAKRIERVLARTRELSAVEDLRNAVTTARLNGEFEVARQLEKQLEIESRITPEMEKHAPLLAAELRQRIENGIELERQLETQSELIERNRAFADELASTLTSGFKNAIANGESFSDTLRNVAAQLFEVVAQATLLDPLQRSLSNSISGALGSADIGGAAAGLSGIFGGFGFAKGGVLSSPAKFTSGGMRAVAGEAGPEALLPLRRGPDGALGVVAQGGGGNVTNVTIHVDGDATDATIAKMERVAMQVFSRAAPGVVRESVAAVAQRNRADRNFLKR